MLSIRDLTGCHGCKLARVGRLEIPWTVSKSKTDYLMRAANG